jgi:Xaa-Pro aminopeptidase
MRKLVLCLVVALLSPLAAQDAPLFTTDFPPEEFSARRAKIFDAIGPNALALIQGAPSPPGYVKFRQSNEFYYLSGVESPHAYLLLDGGARRTTLFLPRRNEARERSEGKVLSADDAELVAKLTAIEEVAPSELLAERLGRFANRQTVPEIFTPFAPAEGYAMSRDLALRAVADAAADPWDGRPSREGQFLHLLRTRFPQFTLRNLTPALDQLRLIKSQRELTVIRRSTDLSVAAILEAMRSTVPGLYEHELDAVAKFFFYRGGAQGDAYYSLIASGPNAWFPHYHRGGRRMQDGELLLMDVGPDVGYYSTDVTRQWPVNGKWNAWQRELYGFYLMYYRAILDSIRPGPVADVKRNALARMKEGLGRITFSKPSYEKSARDFVAAFEASSSSSLGHWVGMAVHDVGPADGILKPNMVFTIEPQFRVDDGQIYVRLEDVVLITETGAENLSRALPMEMPAIEKVMAEEGMLQRYPRLVSPQTSLSGQR